MQRSGESINASLSSTPTLYDEASPDMIPHWEAEIMASDYLPIAIHELKHSPQLVATHEALKPFDDRCITKTEPEDAIMTDQAGETAVSQIIYKVDPNPTQRLLAAPSDQILFTTEARDIITTKEADTQDRTQRAPSSVSTHVQVISEEEYTRTKEDLISKPQKETRRMSKRIKEQELRNVELSNDADLNGRGLIDTHAELQLSRKDLQDAIACRQEAAAQLIPSQRGPKTRKNQLSPAQNGAQKVQQVKKQLASVRRELKASKGLAQETQKELEQERRKLAASQYDLTACKDELFRLQPIAQVPDSRVAKEFEYLCQQITNWVEAAVAIFEKAHPEEGQEHVFSIGEDNNAAQFMARHPRGGEHLAVSMIHDWLQDNLFGRNLSCVGLPAEAVQLLERVEQSMTCLDPPRDSTTIAAWRSETIKALVSTAECEESRVRETQDMTGRLFKELSKTLPILFGWSQTQYSFSTQISQPAVNLASTIQESTAKYEWSWQKYVLRKWKTLDKAILKNHKMIDMKTGKCLKPDSLAAADRQSIIANPVLKIEPALYRVEGKGQRNVLRKGTIIANLESPFEKRD